MAKKKMAKAYAIGVGLLIGTITSFLAYVVFDWVLIRLWEWHLGHRMMITVGLDVLAILLAFLTFACALYGTYP